MTDIILDDDSIDFMDEEEKEIVVESNLPPWNILIADDEPGIHQVTKLVLANVKIDNRPLKLYNVYTGAETIKFITEHSNIHFLLLDCVMESETAGFECAKYIKTVLKREIPIIVLRTGWAPSFIEAQIDAGGGYLDDFIYKTDTTKQVLLDLLAKWLVPIKEK